MSEELKPCPFCGSEEVYVEEYEHHPGAMRWRVLCVGCMAGIDTGTRQLAGEAVQDWNRRAERTCCPVLEDETLVCSECGEDIDGYGWNYCPNCGAKVMGE